MTRTLKILRSHRSAYAFTPKTRCNLSTLLELCPLEFYCFGFWSCVFKYYNAPQYLEYCHMDVENTFLLVPKDAYD